EWETRCCGRGARDPRELSLEEVLKSYEQPINEEQAWAVCYQCCGALRVPPARPGLQHTPVLHLSAFGASPCPTPHATFVQLVQSMGVAIYRALDWGLADSEERELSPQLERLIERMLGGEDGTDISVCASSATEDEGYSGPEEEDEQEEEGTMRAVCTFRQVMALCACRLANPVLAPEHYQAVCRALYLETLELQTFLCRIRDAKEMLRKIKTEEPQEERCAAELDNLKNTDWARLWVQLMKELRQGVKLKKVEQVPFDLLPSEFSLTPFEMLMKDIRSRKYNLRKVMVDGDIPSRVKQNAHEMILDFIRSRPPLKPVSERTLPPRPLQQTLHDRVLAEIRQEHKLRPVEPQRAKRPFGSLPCLAFTCHCELKSTSCIDLSIMEAGCRPLPRPRILLKAPTLAEMEEMNLFEVRVESSPVPLKRDRSFSEHDLVELREDLLTQPSAGMHLRGGRPRCSTFTAPTATHTQRALHAHTHTQSHPVESLALTVDEVISVRRVLVKAEMEKFLQSKELYNNLRKGKVCCCCRIKFPLFSWPSTCLLCKRFVGRSVSMKMPSKKMAHIPVYTVGFHSSPKSHAVCTWPNICPSPRSLSLPQQVEEEFPYLYATGCVLRDVCADCTKFVCDVVSSSRRSLDFINNTPKREKPHPHDTLDPL
uniref:KIND domain-containing protein n=1 Tax=Electrophorus electricus TaxID=8005 RepID=A0A4W4H8V1_ELEEL